MLEFLEYMLDKEGYRVTSTDKGKQALEWISKQSDFDLVISDLRMPDLDGLELLRATREVDTETPFIFMTAYASSETAIESLKLGAFPRRSDESKQDYQRPIQRWRAGRNRR